MKIVVLAGTLLLVFATSAMASPLASDTADYGRKPAHKQARSLDASPHRHRQVASYKHRTERVAQRSAVVAGRPSQCYGMAWCGCYLRNYLGIADKSLNLAINWAGVGRAASPHNGVVVVWRHHVGLMRSDPDASGRAIVLSGNDGGAARERLRSIRGAVAFREV